MKSKRKGEKRITDFEKFREQFMEDVKEAYAEASGREVTVSSHKINKMNDSYEAITISPKGSSIGLNLNVDAYYEAYNLGKEYDALIDKAVEVIQTHIDFKDFFQRASSGRMGMYMRYRELSISQELPA